MNPGFEEFLYGVEVIHITGHIRVWKPAALGFQNRLHLCCEDSATIVNSVNFDAFPGFKGVDDGL